MTTIAWESFPSGSHAVRGNRPALYYAGHAMQIDGQNYLLPTNENIRTEKGVTYDVYQCESGS